MYRQSSSIYYQSHLLTSDQTTHTSKECTHMYTQIHTYKHTCVCVCVCVCAYSHIVKRTENPDHSTHNVMA